MLLDFMRYILRSSKCEASFCLASNPRRVFSLPVDV